MTSSIIILVPTLASNTFNNNNNNKKGYYVLHSKYNNTMRNSVIRYSLSLLVLIVLSSAHLDAFTTSSASVLVPRVRQDIALPPSAIHANIFQTTAHSLTQLRAGAIHDEGSSSKPSFITKAVNFANNNFFLVGMFIAVSIAKWIPSLGVNGSILRPELSIGKYGVGLIFLLSGLSLKMSELTKAVSNVKLNGLIQVAIFALWPFLIGVPLQNILSKVNIVPPALVDGLLIMTCLPTTVNMCIMLTSSSGGNVATSICNAVISNMAGIFVTPALLLHFFGANIKLPFVDMVLKLCKKVLLPVAIGQGLRATKAKDVYESNSKSFKRLQEVCRKDVFCLFYCLRGSDLSGCMILSSYRSFF
jgi:hypothetical protein